MSDRATVSIRIDPKLWMEAKITAIKSGISVSELVETALKKELKK